ncbi:hydroxyacylglutathione hydrolase [Thiomicrorhabdus xiamenensis]|uniref:Hydroxyacylglutathione hydrolase n=1 Tax=Thiomicrorhabdus xiamenensis TaxID=2739063 RepID=A0A7D4NQZ3_9GAMM|nr:hydroxyacylglutathione hydrolase [Thiomicrorhabdus xiamenensis]QKI89372.1 hydroxyacylglutathione hydrolase [Thiomicrorhabdus xiamenensis]
MIQIAGIPALVGTYDNYIWVLYDTSKRKAWVFDPGESAPVIDYLEAHKLHLEGILITHRHFDHVDGIPGLKQTYPDAIVYGPVKTQNPLIEKRLQEGDEIKLSDELSFKVLDTPGHTEDHISYYNEHALFCADTLFTGGCGRLLGGTPQEFAESLIKLRNLPDHLDFYCAHEYTEDNLRFAAYVDENNAALKKRIENLDIHYPQIHNGQVSTLGLEKETNPFLRFDQQPIKDKLKSQGSDDSAEMLFATLREWKDRIDQGLESID